MTTRLIPQPFWFRLAVPCRRVDGVPRSGAKGPLLDLPESCALPDLGHLEGQPSWARVRLGWNPAGLAVAVEALGKPAPTLQGDQPDLPHGVQIWVDTRDTRDVHRATRFCHRFAAQLAATGARGSLGVAVMQRQIARALADAPPCRAESIPARAERLPKGWRLELFLPADVLHGFDPETNRRLGFAYQVSDPDRDDQFFSVGRDFPIGEDPSLWATLELLDEG